MNKLLLGLATLAAVTALVACAKDESATSPPEVGETTAAQTGWTAEQRAQYRADFRAGEALLRTEIIMPELVVYATPTSEEELTCTIGVLESLYPTEADRIIAEMWSDTTPDDTPGIDDTISWDIIDAMMECN